MSDVAALPETVAEGKMTTTMNDAWDYKGRPAVRASSGGWSSAAMILVVELNERLTTLGVGVNLVTYLIGTMHLGGAASANAVTNFLGASFMLCLLGGFVADTYLGRYLTIAIFTAVQAAVRRTYYYYIIWWSGGHHASPRAVGDGDFVHCRACAS
jgi:hypothetical protein